MIDLSGYANLRICVAVSGGRDSMALLHFIYTHAAAHNITLSALNCDHKIRGLASAADSAFVKSRCKEWGIPLIFFEREELGADEASARRWRLDCYKKAAEPHVLENGEKWEGADAIATAHHLNDNAETVLLNLARGSAASGLKGICDGELTTTSGKTFKLIRPFITLSREEIDSYILENSIDFVTDESNLSDRYTRNVIRRRVLPELEKAVPRAAEAIFRFSRLAAEDESFFAKLIREKKLVEKTLFGVRINHCEERALFTRAAISALKILDGDIKDYTSTHANKLYELQFKENGKRFDFLKFSAYKEGERLVISSIERAVIAPLNFRECLNTSLDFGGVPLKICERGDVAGLKELRFDLDKIPEGAVIRCAERGDKFKKFGGGRKSLGDYFTDKKIPVRLRERIPLVCAGKDVLAVCGVEISDGIKIDGDTRRIYKIICYDFITEK